MINDLVNRELIRRDFKFLVPVFIDSNEGSEVSKLGKRGKEDDPPADAVEEEKDEDIIGHEEKEWHLARYLRADRTETETTPAKAELAEEEARYQESPVDPNEWQREYRRVREKLKDGVGKTDSGHYMAHIQRMLKLFQSVKDILEIAGTACLSNFAYACDNALTTISGYEKRLNSSVPVELVGEAGCDSVVCGPQRVGTEEARRRPGAHVPSRQRAGTYRSLR